MNKRKKQVQIAAGGHPGYHRQWGSFDMNRAYSRGSRDVLILLLIVFAVGCSSRGDNYDEVSWRDALLNKQNVLDVKPEKEAEFSELFSSPSLAYVDHQYIYIYDSREGTVCVYSRNDYRLKLKFGKKGEGPGEFQRLHNIKVYEDFVFINSTGKNSYFSKDGRLQKEVRSPPHLIPCLPIGDNFVSDEYSWPPAGGHRTPFTEKKIILVGPDFKTRKILFQKSLNIAIVYDPKTGRNKYTLFSDYCSYRVYKNKIYIGLASPGGFFFTVFSANGRKLYEINRAYIKRSTPDFLKQAILKKPYRLHWNNQVLKINFYKYLPSFSSFEVADDLIYIFLFPENGNQRILVMDLTGKLIGVTLVPFDLKSLEESSYQIFYSEKYIYKGESYYLKDNDKTNKWELWRLRLIDKKML